MFVYFPGVTTQCGCIFHSPVAGVSLLIRGSLIIHNDAPRSVGLLWTSDQIRHTDLYLTTHNNHNKQTSMPPVGFEPIISKGERPKTYALDRTATGTGTECNHVCKISGVHEMSFPNSKIRSCVYVTSSMMWTKYHLPSLLLGMDLYIKSLRTPL